MFKKITIQNDQRGMLFRRGSYIRCLQPGTYRLSSFSVDKVEVLNVTKPFAVQGKDLHIFLQDQALLRELAVIDVRDYEYVLWYEDGKYAGFLKPGKYAFWTVFAKQEFVRADVREPELSASLDRSIIPKLGTHVQICDVGEQEIGLLYFNHELQRQLQPGRYYFWRGPSAVVVKTIDMRRQQLDMTGQEMLTEDKIPLRLNFVCQYQVTNPLQTITIAQMKDQLYILLQLILREYVGTMKLDELLRVKREVGDYVLNRLREKEAEFGVTFSSAGVKDVILPGDVKDILNTVLLAEKKAQANLITRREETASTRSLLNTAKLMEENGTLFRLKELEYLEKMCEKIGTVSLMGGGGGLLEHMSLLLKSGQDRT
ncbi:slipin family protein [Paenibacillus sp. R14(2021)]|uniref:slipin family protein n=1 Tax=Paenibacillus sp. R14(2021) TaxID=2859228 RepID=UPI001C6147B2|nr:slipin family protein [Paenibacillus sp. R14(2021)]